MANVGGQAVQPVIAPQAPAASSSPAIFPAAVSAAYSQEEEGKARVHTCMDQYNLNKATNRNGGLKWIQEGGGYYSACNEKLKSAAESPPQGNAQARPATPRDLHVLAPAKDQQKTSSQAGSSACGNGGGRGRDIRGIRLGMKPAQLPCEFATLPRVPAKTLTIGYEMMTCSPMKGVPRETCVAAFFTDGTTNGEVFEVFAINVPLGILQFEDNAKP
jgi:hypothetical protein